jgi:uncharacterized ferritin-like protein (DUF455 family)
MPIQASARYQPLLTVNPMQLDAYARSIVLGPELDAKLRPPPAPVLDDERSPATWLGAPGRSDTIRIRPASEVKVPKKSAMSDPKNRARIVHALANHELQAIELFAWALLAFPDMPAGFRRGLLAILVEEQRHMQLYIDSLHECGADFGDFPVTGHFWNKIESVRTPLAFVCTMGLTFENANLDFAQEYATHALAGHDHALARTLAIVHEDEIGHVRFAWKWLHKLKPAQQSAWDAYCENVAWPLGPHRARGKSFDVESRRAAGFDQAFIDQLAQTAPKRPSGAPR